MAEEKKERYKLSDEVKKHGYNICLDSEGKLSTPANGGKLFVVSKQTREVVYDKETGQPKRSVVPGSIIKNGKPTGEDYFEDLTPGQIHQFAQANVIILTQKQGIAYNSYLQKEVYK